jgi:hypothetical protein
LADALVALVNRPGFTVRVIEYGDDEHVLLEGSDPAALVAYVLKCQRMSHGMSLADVADALGASSRNAYARYEHGTSVPTIDKLAELLQAVAPDVALIIGERTPGKPRRTRSATSARRRASTL